MRDTTTYQKIADSFEEQGAPLMVGIDGSYGTFETQRDLHKQFLAWVSADPRLSWGLSPLTQKQMAWGVLVVTLFAAALSTYVCGLLAFRFEDRYLEVIGVGIGRVLQYLLFTR